MRIAGAIALLCFSSALAAQGSPAAARDSIDGTMWLGTLKSPTGVTPYGLAFRRSPKGSLFLVEYMPVMHVYSQVVSRVTVQGSQYVFADLPGYAKLDGTTLRGAAFYASMPFELTVTTAFPPPEDTWASTAPAPPPPRWTRPLGAPIWATPVLREETIYVGAADGRFHAVHASDGTAAWVWRDSTPVYGQALVTSDAVFFVNARTELIRLDRATGSLRWRVGLDSARRRPATVPDDDTFNHRTAAPVLADGMLFIGSTDGSVLAIDPVDGDIKWRVATGAKVCAPAAIAGDRIIVGTYDGTLLALRRADGHEVWRRKFAAAIVSAPVIREGTAYVGARDYALHAVRLADGGDDWTQHFWASWVESTPRVANGALYVGSSDLRAVRALDPQTGKVQWSTDVFGAVWGSPAVGGDVVYVGVAAVTGYMIVERASLVALDRRTGALLWRHNGESAGDAPVSGYSAAPVYANRTLFVAGLDGILSAWPVP